MKNRNNSYIIKNVGCVFRQMSLKNFVLNCYVINNNVTGLGKLMWFGGILWSKGMFCFEKKEKIVRVTIDRPKS